MLNKCYIVPVQKACNCDCIFCISKSRDYDKEDEFLKVDDEFIENIKLLKRRGIKKIEITGGGEPMLHPNIELIVSIIKEIISDCYIKIYTNGFILKKVEGIDEVNISLVSDNDRVNDYFMNPKSNVSFAERIGYYRESYPLSKLRLSIPLMKGGIDSLDKLNDLINSTSCFVDEYVVRTLYPHSLVYEKDYVEFPIDNDKVIYEKDNDVSDFDGLILWSDNQFYKDFNLNLKRYLYGYLLLKPDSAIYINEIEEIIRKFGLDVVKKYLIKNFDEVALEFYQEKDDDYKKVIQNHVDNLVYLFGNDALIYILDGNYCYQKLLEKVYDLKLEIRRQLGFTEKKHGYILKDGNISHLNLCHCPDAISTFFERDLSNIDSFDKTLLSENNQKILRKYRSYHL